MRTDERRNKMGFFPHHFYFVCGMVGRDQSHYSAYCASRIQNQEDEFSIRDDQVAKGERRENIHS